MQIIKDIFLVSGFAYGLHPNVYAVKGEDAAVLIDTGLAEADLAVIDQNLAYWGLDKHPISHVLITHSHFDHCGNAHHLRKRGAKIAAGPGDAEGIECGDERTIDYAYQMKFPACPVDLKVSDGDVIHAAGLDFTVIHVPGHSGGCVFYRLELDGKVVMFTGDAVRVVGNCESAVLGWSGGTDYDRERYFSTLKKISRLQADIVLAGHFQPCLRDGWRIFQKAYMKALLEWRGPATYE
ncbi:MAG: MBL fold metallo-hydrolase [Bacillota bacterium]